jgi:hypothetical protein
VTQLVPSSSIPTASQSSAQVIIGNRFRPAADMTLRSIWWFRWLTTDASPTRLVIYHASDSAIVLDVAVTADSSAIGWKSQNVADTVLSGGVDYVVAVLWASGSTTHISGWATAPPSPGDGYTVVGARYAQPSTSTSTPPTTTSTWELAAVSVSSDPAGTGSGGTPATPGDAEVVSGGWLSSDPDVNQHQADGLPWLTKLAVDDIATSVGSGLHTAVTAIGTAVTAIGTAVTSTGTAVNGISTALATHMGAWSADLAATIQAWNDGLVDWFNRMGGLAGGPVGALSGRTAFPSEGWTLADETDWDTDLAWPVAADLYVFTVTTPPPGAAADSFAGVTWYHRLGSWTTLDGDQAGARAFLEFSPQQLQDGGRRMPGLAFRTKNGTLGHVQAWLLA